MAKKRAATDAIAILHRRHYRGRPVRLKALAEARANEEIARHLRELRIAAGLSQAQLATMVGTTASVISRIEDANYEGHTLTTLRKIAEALHQRIEIRFEPISA